MLQNFYSFFSYNFHLPCSIIFIFFVLFKFVCLFSVFPFCSMCYTGPDSRSWGPWAWRFRSMKEKSIQFRLTKLLLSITNTMSISAFAIIFIYLNQTSLFIRVLFFKKKSTCSSARPQIACQPLSSSRTVTSHNSRLVSEAGKQFSTCCSSHWSRMWCRSRFFHERDIFFSSFFFRDWESLDFVQFTSSSKFSN